MDPQLIKEILSKNYQYLKPQSHPHGKYLISGIVTYEGDKWAKQRKLLNPAFHMEKLKVMLPAFYSSCVDTVSKWEDLVALSKGACELDVWPHLQTLTADAISKTAFGSNYEEGRKVFELLREQTKLVVMAFRSLYLPGMRFLPTKMNRRIKAIAKEIEVSVTGVINKRIQAMKAGEARTDDLLGILLEPNLEEIEDRTNKCSAMTIHEIIQECKLFYFAGQETTSTLLVWTMVLLGKHPDWQERAREEVLQKFGYEKPGFEDLNQLKIVTMILYEVLRLYPSVPTLGRKTAKEMKLGNLTLPEGVHILLPFMLLHHDLELWGADAKEFKPERFSEGVLKATKGNASFFAFSGGPRICIGQNFALLEAKVALVTILQRFSFELSPSYTHAPYNMLTLQPQHGAHFILHKLMLPAFCLSCMDTLSKWEDVVASTKEACELDVWPHLQTLTADAISRTAFGSNYEEGMKVFELLREQTQLVIMSLRSLYLPGMRFIPTKMNRRIKDIAKEIEVSITDDINKRIKAMRAGEGRTEDLLDILIQPNFKEIEDQRNESSAMSINEIIEECKLFYLAGHETTSALLMWTMVLLGKHLEWQERAREEVLQKFGYEKPGY